MKLLINLIRIVHEKASENASYLSANNLVAIHIIFSTEAKLAVNPNKESEFRPTYSTPQSTR
jgi:hypothetical protein